jgi:hypothetical protein
MKEIRFYCANEKPCGAFSNLFKCDTSLKPQYIRILL